MKTAVVTVVATVVAIAAVKNAAGGNSGKTKIVVTNAKRVAIVAIKFLTKLNTTSCVVEEPYLKTI